MRENQNATFLSVTPVHEALETNFFGLIQTTIAFLPLLRKPTHAVILKVSTDMASNTIQARPKCLAAPCSIQCKQSSRQFIYYCIGQNLKEIIYELHTHVNLLWNRIESVSLERIEIFKLVDLESQTL